MQKIISRSSLYRYRNIYSFSREIKHTYDFIFNKSIEDPVNYWREEARHSKWKTFPKTTLRVDDQNFFKWFPDGQMNISENCIDVHLEHGLGDTIAYAYESPITGKRSTTTYNQFHQRVQQLAGSMISDFKIKPGDRIIIYMPMVVESIIAMLACARIGATHIVVFGGFSAQELANRINDSEPKLIICSNAGKQPNRIIDYKAIINKSLQITNKKIPKIIFQRPDLLEQLPLTSQEFDFLEVEKSGNRAKPIYLPSNHPLYILYTSGTTGAPKGIVRDHGGTSVILKNAMKYVFNMKQGESMFCSSDIGWVLGHSFIIYAPLLAGIKSVLFEGKPVGTPTADVFWKAINQNQITHLYTSPTAMRTIRKEDPKGQLISQYDLSCLKSVSMVGERCDVGTFEWVQNHFKNQFIIDNFWQTETGSPILSNFLGFDKPFGYKPGSACKPVPGFNVKIMNTQTGQQCAPNEAGTIYIKHPMPPSFMLTILNHDQKYVEKYCTSLKGHYNTGDSGYRDEDGYFYIMSREDDVINTAGHRLSTGQMQEVVMKQNDIAEAIVVGVNDEIKGEIPVAFVTIKSSHIGKHDPEKTVKQAISLVRQHIGPVASFKECHIVARLPKTRSGKYLRHIVRKMYNKHQYDTPSTVEDVDVIFELQGFFKNFHQKKK